MEVFKDIPGYEGLYVVSNKGTVKSLPKTCGGARNRYVSKEKVLKNRINSRGYYMNTLTKNNKPKNFNTHQLVAMAFLNHKPNGYKKIVDHVNGNKLDNRVDNLQVTSNRHNCSKDKTPKSGYTGVVKNGSKWCARIRVGGKLKHLGQYNTTIEAAKAYQKELKKLSHA